MKRTRFNVPLANNFIRPSIFAIVKNKADDDPDIKQIRRYGDSVVISYGRLYEEDRAVLLILMQMYRENQHERFNFKLSEIAKRKGIKNPYDETSLKPLRDSINRMLDTQIRIRPDKPKGLSARFVLAEGYMKDDEGCLRLGAFFDIVELFVIGKTYVNLPQYMKIRSNIGRSLFLFLSSQRPFYGSGKPYEISTRKLIEYLNWETNDRPYWQVILSLKSAVIELKKNNLIGRYRLYRERCKQDGGVWSFKAAQKEPQQKSIGTQNDESLKLISEKLQITIEHPNTWRAELNKLRDHWGNSFKHNLADYCDWLKDNKGAEYYTPGLFRVSNAFFRQFDNPRHEREKGYIPSHLRDDNSHPNDFL